MDKRDILLRLLGEETVSRVFGRAADAVDKVGDAMEETAEDARRLDSEIETAEESLRSLAAQFARTQDAAERLDLAKAMRKQQAELRRMTKVRDLLPDLSSAGEEAATGFAAQFGQALSSAMSKVPMGPPGAIIGAGLAVALTPALAAGISGAILGGAGAIGVAGYVSLAAKDSRVKAAGQELAAQVMGDLEGSATRFVKPTIAGVREIQSAWSDVSDEVDDVGASASRYVVPLARGVAGALREIGPGFRDAVAAAGPVIREISEGLPRIGRALGDVLSDVSGDADSGASAVRGMVMAAEGGIRTFGALVSTIADAYRWTLNLADASGALSERWVGWVPILGDQVRDSNGRLDELRAAMTAGGEEGWAAGDRIFGGLQKVEEGASGATEEIESLSDALSRMSDEAIESERLSMRLAEAIDEATEAGKRNNDGISQGTEKGRANRELLLSMGEAAKKVAADVRTQTGDHQRANLVLEESRAKFLATAKAMGAEAREAEELANKIFGIPLSRNSKITADTSGATRSVQTYVQWLNSIPRTVRTRMITEQQTAKGGHREFSAGGYVDGTTPRGVDAVPALLAVGEGVLDTHDIDALGGPAGFARLRAMLKGRGGAALQAGSGATGATGGGAGGAGGASMVVLNFHAGSVVLSGVQRPEELVSALQRYASQNGPIRLPVVSP